MSADLLGSSEPNSVRFLLSADPSPGLLPRLLEPFARRDLIPDRVTARFSGSTMQVEIAMAAMPGEMLSFVEGSLRQVIGLRGLIRETASAAASAA
jgi:hypothetical protein